MNVIYVRDGTVSAVDLTALGLPTNASQFAEYEASPVGGTVTWNAGGLRAANIYLQPEAGEKQECDTALFVLPTDCTDGKDGDPRTYLLQFSGNTVTVSRLDAIYNGVAF